MSAGAIEVLRPGALTIVQDLGRAGFAASGVPRGGAMDPWAARAANRTVGNPDDAALLEITLAGPELRFHAAATVALVGDPFDVRINDRGADPAEILSLQKEDRLEIGRALSGVRAWLAVGGGLDVPEILGSRATDLAGGFGGHEGRALRAGDRLTLFPSPEVSGVRNRRADSGRAEGGGSAATILRVLPGPDQSLLDDGAAAALSHAPLRVDPRSDRRGVRLAGGHLPLRPHPPLRSQPVLPGTVQAPSADELIVLGPDAPVTGGYPWIAQVIAADLGLLAHLAPGSAVRLEPVDLATAEHALSVRWRMLERGALS